MIMSFQKSETIWDYLSFRRSRSHQNETLRHYYTSIQCKIYFVYYNKTQTHNVYVLTFDQMRQKCTVPVATWSLNECRLCCCFSTKSTNVEGYVSNRFRSLSLQNNTHSKFVLLAFFTENGSHGWPLSPSRCVSWDLTYNFQKGGIKGFIQKVEHETHLPSSVHLDKIHFLYIEPDK